MFKAGFEKVAVKLEKVMKGLAKPNPARKELAKHRVAKMKEIIQQSGGKSVPRSPMSAGVDALAKAKGIKK